MKIIKTWLSVLVALAMIIVMLPASSASADIGGYTLALQDSGGETLPADIEIKVGEQVDIEAVVTKSSPSLTDAKRIEWERTTSSVLYDYDTDEAGFEHIIVGKNTGSVTLTAKAIVDVPDDEGSHEDVAAERTLDVTVTASPYTLSLSKVEGETETPIPDTGLAIGKGEDVGIKAALVKSDEADPAPPEDFAVTWTVKDDNRILTVDRGDQTASVTAKEKGSASITATATIDIQGQTITIAPAVTVPVTVGESPFMLALKVSDHTLDEGALTDLEAGEKVSVTTALYKKSGTSYVPATGVDYSVSWSSSDTDKTIAFDKSASPVTILGKDYQAGAQSAAITATAKRGSIEIATTTMPVTVVASTATLALYAPGQGTSEALTSLTARTGEEIDVTTGLTGLKTAVDSYTVSWSLDKTSEQGPAVTDYLAREFDEEKASIVGKKGSGGEDIATLTATAVIEIDGTTIHVTQTGIPVKVEASRYILKFFNGSDEITGTLELGVPDQVAVTAKLYLPTEEAAGEPTYEEVQGDIDFTWSKTKTQDPDSILSLNDSGDTATITCASNGTAALSARARMDVGGASSVEVATKDLQVAVSPSTYKLVFFKDGHRIAGDVQTEALQVGQRVDSITAAVIDLKNKGTAEEDTPVAGFTMDWENTDDEVLEQFFVTDASTGEQTVSVIGKEAKNGYLKVTAEKTVGDVDVEAQGTLKVEVSASSYTLKYTAIKDGDTQHPEDITGKLQMEVGGSAEVSATLMNGTTPVTSTVEIVELDNTENALSYDQDSVMPVSLTGMTEGSAYITATAYMEVPTVGGHSIKVAVKPGVDLDVDVAYPSVPEKTPKERTGTRIFTFAPDSSDNYTFTSAGNADTSAVFVDEDGTPLTPQELSEIQLSNIDNYSGNNFRVDFRADKDITYYLKTTATDTTAYTVGIERGPQFFDADYKSADTELAVGQEESVNTNVEDGLFTFTPDKSEHYVFYAAGSDNARIRVLDDNGIVAPTGINPPEGDASQYPSEIEFQAIAGTKYYLQAVNSVGKATFTVGLTNGSEETRQAAQNEIDKANRISSATYTSRSYAAVVAAKKELEKCLAQTPPASIKTIQDKTASLTAAINSLKLKGANPLRVTFKNKKIKKKAVRRKKQAYKAVYVYNVKGGCVYTAKGTNKKSRKALSFNKNTGKITIKKKTKKGTYKMTITVRDVGNGDYKASGTFKKTITIKVK